MKQIIAAAVCALSAASVFAQYPERAINYVIPFVPAGESDIAARLQGKVATKITGKEFVVQNKPGAGGAVAWAQLNSLPSDGYTVMGTNLPHILLQPLEAQPTYKTEDIVNVFFFHFTPDALVVAADCRSRRLPISPPQRRAIRASSTSPEAPTTPLHHWPTRRPTFQDERK